MVVMLASSTKITNAPAAHSRFNEAVNLPQRAVVRIELMYT